MKKYRWFHVECAGKIYNPFLMWLHRICKVDGVAKGRGFLRSLKITGRQFKFLERSLNLTNNFVNILTITITFDCTFKRCWTHWTFLCNSVNCFYYFIFYLQRIDVLYRDKKITLKMCSTNLLVNRYCITIIIKTQSEIETKEEEEEIFENFLQRSLV